MTKRQPEGIIERSILEYLAMKNIFAFKVKTMGTYDAKIGRFRSPSKYSLRGISDILGIHRGRFLAIEVKTPRGRLSLHQKLFIERVKEYGGIAFVARSVGDVALALNEVEQTQPQASQAV